MAGGPGGGLGGVKQRRQRPAVAAVGSGFAAQQQVQLGTDAGEGVCVLGLLRGGGVARQDGRM